MQHKNYDVQTACKVIPKYLMIALQCEIRNTQSGYLVEQLSEMVGLYPQRFLSGRRGRGSMKFDGIVKLSRFSSYILLI